MHQPVQERDRAQAKSTNEVSWDAGQALPLGGSMTVQGAAAAAPRAPSIHASQHTSGAVERRQQCGHCKDAAAVQAREGQQQVGGSAVCLLQQRSCCHIQGEHCRGRTITVGSDRFQMLQVFGQSATCGALVACLSMEMRPLLCRGAVAEHGMPAPARPDQGVRWCVQAARREGACHLRS